MPQNKGICKNKFYSFIRWLLVLPTKIVFPTKLIGRENMPKNPRMITVTNHLSWVDVLMLAVYIKGFRHIIGKKEVGKNKFLYKRAIKLGIILIDRSKADLNAIRESINVLKDGGGISIFPEGTRNKTDESLHEIKNGVTMLAVKGQSPIVPIMIYRKAKIFRKNYMYIGKTFSLSEYDGKRLDLDTLSDASNKVEERMRVEKDYLDDYVAKKRWIAAAKEKKQENIRIKVLNKQARKDYKQAKKQSN